MFHFSQTLPLTHFILSLEKYSTLLILAAVRHTAGYSWANNNFNYFNTYHEGKEIGKIHSFPLNQGCIIRLDIRDALQCR